MSHRLIKVLDVRRRKPAPAKAGGGAIEGNAADDALMVVRTSILRLTPE